MAWQTVIDFLEYYELSLDVRQTVDMEERFANGSDWIVAYVLDSCGLIEHGSGIAWGWILPDGQDALEFLDQHGPNWRDNLNDGWHGTN